MAGIKFLGAPNQVSIFAYERQRVLITSWHRLTKYIQFSVFRAYTYFIISDDMNE